MEKAVNAIFAKDTKTLEALIQSKEYDVNSFISIDRSGLALAAACGYTEVMQTLIDNGADVNLNNEGDLGYTPLEAAARDGKLVAMNLLIENGAEIDKGNTNNSNALFGACIGAHLKALEYLIAQGANVNHTDNRGQTALHYLCLYAKQWGGGTITQTVNGITTELPNNRFQEHTAIFNCLLDNGADVNLLTGFGYSPLHCAAESDTDAFIRLLIAKGADVNVQNSKGFSPLHAAADRGKLLSCLELLDNGADVNIVDLDGFTPILGAVSAKNVPLVQLFLNKGANTDTKAKIAYGNVSVGDDVKSLATKLGNKEIIELLK